MDLLTFSLDQSSYALPVSTVVQIHRAVAITSLPGAPRAIEGAINVRGQIIPVIDLRRRFGLGPRSVALTDIIILVNAGARTIAVRATGNACVLAVEPHQIELPEDIYPHPRYVRGIARLADGLLVIHDPSSFLSEAESAELEAALAIAEAAG